MFSNFETRFQFFHFGKIEDYKSIMVRIATYKFLEFSLIEKITKSCSTEKDIALELVDFKCDEVDKIYDMVIIKNETDFQNIYDELARSTISIIFSNNSESKSNILTLSSSRKGKDIIIDPIGDSINIEMVIEFAIKALLDQKKLVLEKSLLNQTINISNQIFDNQCKNFGLIEWNLPIGLGIVDHGKLIFANWKLKEIMGYPKESKITQEQIQCENGPTIQRICRVLALKKDRVNEIQIMLPSGNVKELQIITDLKTNTDSRHIFTVLETSKINETRLIKDITLALHEISGNHSTVNKIVDKIGQTLESFFVGFSFKISRYNPKNETLNIQYRNGQSTIHDEVTITKSIVSKVLWENRTLFIDNNDFEYRNRDFMLHPMEETPAQWLGIPLQVNNNVVGILTVQSSNTENQIDSNLANLAELISPQISLMLSKAVNAQIVNDSLRKAEESDRLKTSFLSNMSHEVRTPLNSIIGFATLLLEEDLDPTETPSFASYILNSGNALLKIIDDIVDIAKIEAGELKINKVDTDLNLLIKDVFKKLSSMLDNESKREIKPELQFDAALMGSIIKTDPFRLRQAIINICENAVKFTAKGKVSICVNKKDDFLTISISDTGIGMEQSKLNNIFDQFKQVEEGDTRLYGGTGIGLSISKSIVKMLGGHISVESTINKGSNFTVILPYEEVKFSQNPSSQSKLKYNWKNKNIIVADDIISNFEYIEALLKHSDANLYYADNGLKAVELVKKHDDIHIILMDLQMPEMDGYQATSIVKSMKPEIPIIVLTAFSQISDKKKAFDAGCDEYLQKPILANQLFSIMSKFLD